MAEVVLENVSRVFAASRGTSGEVTAVERVNLEIKDQEFLVLVGPSGCGKSTTLRMIAGLEEISSGEIRIGGERVNHTPPSKRNIAMVFQNYALYPHMSVYRNMAFGLELRRGVSGWWAQALTWIVRRKKAAEMAAARYEIAERVHQTARTLGIEHLLERMPRDLSGGERQRVALGRAIVRQPAAFLFDEPLSNLDAKLRVELRREIKALHRRLQATMIYVTHDQVEALTLGDRIAVMNRGVLQQVGTPQEVYDRPASAFVAGFIGTPPMNLLAGRLEGRESEVWFRCGSWELPISTPADYAIERYIDRPITMGVRAEDISISNRNDQGHGSAARVAVTEPLGDATLVELEFVRDGATESAGCSVQSKIGARVEVAAGDQVTVSLDPQRLHWFDPETGTALWK
jgi:multiple sugar transport system ATP-binding protein